MKIFTKTAPHRGKKCILKSGGYGNASSRFAFALYFGIRISDLDIPDILVNLQNRRWNIFAKSEKENDRVWFVGRRGYKNNRRQNVHQTIISSKKTYGGFYGHDVCV